MSQTARVSWCTASLPGLGDTNLRVLCLVITATTFWHPGPHRRRDTTHHASRSYLPPYYNLTLFSSVVTCLRWYCFIDNVARLRSELEWTSPY